MPAFLENTPEAKQKATNAFLNAIDKYPISIIAHLDSILQTDLYQIGKACAEKGVFVEINNRHTNWTQEQMDELLASGCSFVLSSDAHCADDIGNVNNAFDIMLKYNIPSERIVNVDFDFGEMSEEHKELNRLYDSYLRQKNKIEIKEKEIQEQKDFSTIKLSKEMEDALAQIEREQRGDYSSSETKEETQEPETDETTVAERNEQNIHNFLNEINSIAGARPQNEIKVNADGGSAENAEETSGESAETEEETKTSLETDQAQTEESESEENAAEAKQNSAETEENKPILENVEVAKKDEIPNAEMKPKSELKRGKAEINLNTKKPEPKEERKSEPEEVKNLFSVNVATGTNAKQDTSAKKTSQNKSNSSSRRGNPGAFVNISSLTGEDDGEN